MSAKEKTHKISRKMKVYLILFALLVISAGLFKFYRINSKNKLHLKMEALRAAGYLLTVEELNQMYSIPETAENAADIILDAMEYYYKEPKMEEIIKLQSDIYLSGAPTQTKPLLKETVTHLGQFLKENEKSLEMLYKASALQYSRYPEDLGKRGGLITVTNSIKLLNLQTVYFSEIGDSDLALQSLISTFNNVKLFASEPKLVFHLAHMSYYSHIVYTLKHVLNRIDFTDEQLIKLNEFFTDALDFSEFPNVIVDEMCRVFDAFNNDDNITVDIISYRVPLPVAQFYMVFYKNLGLVDKDRILYLDYMSKYIEAAKLPLNERYDTFRKIDEQRQNISGIHLINTIFPMYSRSIDKTVITQIQTVKAAISVKRYSLANGSLPDSLNDLIDSYLDEIPITPEGKELKYKKIEEGCIIYSEGNRNNINKTTPQSDLDLINHGIPHLDVWFIIEYDKDD